MKTIFWSGLSFTQLGLLAALVAATFGGSQSGNFITAASFMLVAGSAMTVLAIVGRVVIDRLMK